MRKLYFIELLVMFCLLLTGSCKTSDLDPDEISNEIRITCNLTDINQVLVSDITASKEVWITSFISNGCFDRQFNSFGQCWTLNTDILPTIRSTKNEVLWADAIKYAFAQTKEGIELYYIDPIRSGVPVSLSDTKLIVRGYVIFNDTIIRYSDPLVLVNPVEYAH